MNNCSPIHSSGNASENMHASVLRQLAQLHKMSLEQLQEKWRELMGDEPPVYKSQLLIKRLSFRIQELFFGALSQPTKSLLKAVADRDPAAAVQTSLPSLKSNTERIMPGTRFVRIWNGNRYEVIASENGFEYQGRPFRSLTAIAKEITGTHWNGKLFFGLRTETGETRNA